MPIFRRQYKERPGFKALGLSPSVAESVTVRGLFTSRGQSVSVEKSIKETFPDAKYELKCILSGIESGESEGGSAGKASEGAGTGTGETGLVRLPGAMRLKEPIDISPESLEEIPGFAAGSHTVAYIMQPSMRAIRLAVNPFRTTLRGLKRAIASVESIDAADLSDPLHVVKRDARRSQSFDGQLLPEGSHAAPATGSISDAPVVPLEENEEDEEEGDPTKAPKKKPDAKAPLPADETLITIELAGRWAPLLPSADATGGGRGGEGPNQTGDSDPGTTGGEQDPGSVSARPGPLQAEDLTLDRWGFLDPGALLDPPVATSQHRATTMESDGPATGAGGPDLESLGDGSARSTTLHVTLCAHSGGVSSLAGGADHMENLKVSAAWQPSIGGALVDPPKGWPRLSRIPTPACLRGAAGGGEAGGAAAAGTPVMYSARPFLEKPVESASDLIRTQSQKGLSELLSCLYVASHRITSTTTKRRMVAQIRRLSGSPHAAHALRLLLAKRAMAPADKAALSTALYCMLRSALPQSIKPDEVFQNARLAMGMLLLRGEMMKVPAPFEGQAAWLQMDPLVVSYLPTDCTDGVGAYKNVSLQCDLSAARLKDPVLVGHAVYEEDEEGDEASVGLAAAAAAPTAARSSEGEQPAGSLPPDVLAVHKNKVYSRKAALARIPKSLGGTLEDADKVTAGWKGVTAANLLTDQRRLVLLRACPHGTSAPVWQPVPLAAVSSDMAASVQLAADDLTDDAALRGDGTDAAAAGEDQPSDADATAAGAGDRPKPSEHKVVGEATRDRYRPSLVGTARGPAPLYLALSRGGSIKRLAQQLGELPRQAPGMAIAHPSALGSVHDA